MSRLPSIFIISLMSSLIGAELTTVVNTTHGPVQGEIKTTVMKSIRYSSFRGIRYAEPPLGYQRFKPPVPSRPWVEVFNATVAMPDCIQTGTVNDIVRGSEDCLFLNVFTPVTNFAKLPTQLKSVMIYFAGGAWRKGTAAIWMYGPDFLIDKDVIIITFNHRLGVLGFLNMNHPNATGNAGLKDQRLVLQWVKKNIKQFGGNPNNVTLFGGSSGAISTFYHVVSEASAGLFHGTIATSGPPLSPWALQPPEAAQHSAKMLAQWLRINSTDQEILLEAFYNASAEDLTVGTYHIPQTVAFGLTAENAIIAIDPIVTECIVHKWYTGNFTKVPQMLGFTDAETIAFACPGVAAHMATIDTYVKMSEMIGIEVAESINKFKEIYGTGTDNFSLLNPSLIQETIDATTDSLFIALVDITQQVLAAYNDDQPIYYYHISFDYPRSLHKLRWKCQIDGPAHGDELAYIFHIPSANYSLDLNDSLALTRDRVTTLWTNFAKYGNPTPDWVSEYSLNITWPDSRMAGDSLEIGNELSTGPRPINDIVRQIESHIWPILPAIGHCKRQSVDRSIQISKSNSNYVNFNVIILSLLLFSI